MSCSANHLTRAMSKFYFYMNFFLDLFYLGVCVFVSVCSCIQIGVYKGLEKDVRSSGAGVSGIFQLPSLGAEI